MTSSPQLRLEALYERLRASDAGRLYSRRSPILGEGDPEADLVIVGEAPGEREDLRPRVFIGPSGDLLDSILRRLRVPRDSVFITNLIKKRPPRNRNPEESEIELSLPFLLEELSIVRPRVVLALGAIPGNALAYPTFGRISALRATRGLRVRSSPHDLDVPLVVTYHPAYILRTLRENPDNLKVMALDIRRAVEMSRGVAQTL